MWLKNRKQSLEQHARRSEDMESELDNPLEGIANDHFNRAEIHGVAAHKGAGAGVTRTFQLRIPPGTERVIMDTAAGIHGQELVEMVRGVDAIIVPVQPSPIDIHACSRFVADLLLVGKVRSLNVPVAVVANRARQRSHGFMILKRFLKTLKIPFITSLRDSQNYVKAAEAGVGIHELDAPFVKRDIDSWAPLADWLDETKEHSEQLEINALKQGVA